MKNKALLFIVIQGRNCRVERREYGWDLHVCRRQRDKGLNEKGNSTGTHEVKLVSKPGA